MKRIVAWSINIVWADETEEVITDVPSWVAKEVDNWLTDLEEEVNADEQLKKEKSDEI